MFFFLCWYLIIYTTTNVEHDFNKNLNQTSKSLYVWQYINTSNSNYMVKKLVATLLALLCWPTHAGIQLSITCDGIHYELWIHYTKKTVPNRWVWVPKTLLPCVAFVPIGYWSRRTCTLHARARYRPILEWQGWRVFYMQQCDPYVDTCVLITQLFCTKFRE